MYLKKIEVQGFKSFANKIVFDFHEGITGIVGPNGSGKSNVSDAVRWVLGEQSAKSLRGGNMQDVIFAGTKLRKPQGYAFVSISLDNGDRSIPIDFDEVTVSRRLFRSGESEYMINGSPVRLKDVNELFYDTGIGKDGYSIIGQGQVEKILSGRPEERRELFDEAAGITKFKRRKTIAIKKLENEQANLHRVSDILAELERQVGPLRRQSDLARQFLRLRDELRVLDANMYLLQEAQISEELAKMQENEGILSKDLERAEAESLSVNRDFEEIDGQVQALENRLSELRESLHVKNIRLKDIQGKMEVLREQINTDRVNLEHYSSRQDAIQQDVESRQTEILLQEREKEKEKASLGKILEQKAEEESKLGLLSEKSAALQAEIAAHQAKKLHKLHDRSALQAKWESNKTNIAQLRIRKEELENRIQGIETENRDLLNRLEKEESKKKELEDIFVRKSAEYKVLQDEQLELEKEESSLHKNIENLRASYQHNRAKLETLRNIAERYDGYGNAIRRVMEAKDRVHGVHGVVADLLKVDRKYELAIEIALGARIQNLVTDSEQSAKVLIAYLKKNKFGRATFLPLDSIQTGGALKNSDILKEKGVIGRADSLVSVDKPYEKLLQHLLSKVIIVDNIDNALVIARKYHYEYRLVSLEGDQLSPGGSLSGGAYKNSSNLLGRKRELEDLEKEIEKNTAKMESLDTSLEEIRRAQQKKAGIQADLQASLSALSLEINTLCNSLQIFGDSKLKSAALVQESLQERNSLLAELEKGMEEEKALQKELDSLEIQDREEDSLGEELQKREGDLKREKEKAYGSLKETELRLRAKESTLEHIEDNMQRLKREAEELISRAKLLDEDIDFEENIRLKNEQIKALEQESLRLGEGCQQEEEDLQEHTLTREKMTGLHKRLFEKKDEILQRLSLLDKDIFRLQAAKEKLEEKLAGIGNYMWTEYELSLGDCAAFKDEELKNPSSLKKSIDSLKGEIRSLGNVNVQAIEEYAAVSQRYEEMKTQYDDIILATEQLGSVIADLDSGMRRQFKEKFALINEEFDKVFGDLFGGGSGRLELEEGTDILESGISIISQPPGKKLQNMMQLSGGEKALTAISLLFAIQNLKPSPFALLDEIEAALDDSNVERFAQYLHRLRDKTQFIVITHRRGTMLHSDRLYGITMQEKGVSTMVSVNLIEDKLD